MTKFQVGDEVEAFGVRGKVVQVYAREACFTVNVRFENGAEDAFTSDGLNAYWHAEPSLKLIKRAKRTITRTAWLVVRKDGGADGYATKRAAEATASAYAHGYALDVVPVTFTFETDDPEVTG